MEHNRPFVVVIAGPNGSGKSSLTRHLLAQGFDFADYINPDDIAAELEGSYEERVRRAQAMADERRAEAIAARRSFSFETVFSHPSKLDVLDQARRAGYEVLLFFVAVDDPTINVERVKTRVHLGRSRRARGSGGQSLSSHDGHAAGYAGAGRSCLGFR